MEFLVFMVLLIWFIRWRRRRRQRQVLSTFSASQDTVNFSGQAVPTYNWQPAPQAPPVNSSFGDGWFPDPTGRYGMRYWNAQMWPEWVSSNDGLTRSDPIVTSILMNGPDVSPTNVAPSRYRAPEPETQMNGPDLNELRRRFRD